MGFASNADGVMAAVSRPTLGLQATFFSAVTVNTTGTTALAANAARQLGVWITSDTNSIAGRVGSNINDALVRLSPAGATNSPAPFFIPGTGPIYVKTDSGISNFYGYYI